MSQDISSTPTQEELEAPVKGYQLESVKQELVGIKTILQKIENQTAGVVSHDVMEKYVDKRIDEKVKHLVDHKNSSIKLGWTILILIISDIATRIFGAIK